MSYIKLKVRSGGIYLGQEKEWGVKGQKEGIKTDRDLSPHPEDSNQKILSLIRDSSIKGLFSYLMGETKKIKSIENNQNPSIKKLNATLDIMVQASALQKRTEPYITTFYERRDVHKNNVIFEPNVNLYQHTFETANSTIKLLKEPLKALFQTESLGEINKQIKDSEVKNNNPEFNSLNTPNYESVPDTKLGKTLKEYFNKQKKQRNRKVSIHKKTIDLINRINLFCEKNSDFRQQFEQFKENGKFSVFTSGVSSNTRHWLDKQYHHIVRGTPAFIVCVDFNIYLSKRDFTTIQSSNHFNWEEVIQQLQNGPNIARWGEGGIVLIDNYNTLTEIGCPYEIKDNIFVEIKTLRKEGLKIKKHSWEPKEEKKKTIKTKSKKH